MTSRLAGQVKRLEVQAGLRRICTSCHGRGRISLLFENNVNLWGDEPETPMPCPECGREWRIHFVYENLGPHYCVPRPDWSRERK